MSRASAAVMTRWVARACSLLSLLALLAFVIGELSAKSARPTPAEWVGLAFFPVGVIAGLILAWRKEKLGGMVALAALIVFYVWNRLRSGYWPRGPFFFLFAVPALLFRVASFLSKRYSRGMQ